MVRAKSNKLRVILAQLTSIFASETDHSGQSTSPCGAGPQAKSKAFLFSFLSILLLSAVPAAAQVFEGTKAFDPASVAPSEPSTLTIELINSDPNPATGVTFTDTFPSGMVAVGTTGTTTCNDPAGAPAVVTVTSGSLSLSGGYVPADGPGVCTVTMQVTPNAEGSFVNTIPAGGVTSSVGSNNDPIEATLGGVLTDITIASSRTGFSYGGATDSYVEFTFNNVNAVDLTGVAFTTPFTSDLTQSTEPSTTTCAGATVATTATTFGLTDFTLPANGSCTMRVYVQPSASINTVTGVNTAVAIPAGTLTSDLGATNVNSASQNITTSTGLVSVKTFTPNVIGLGETGSLTLRLTNRNFSALSDVTFVDSLPAGVTFVPGTMTTTCGDGVEDATDTTQFTLTGADLAGNLTTQSVAPFCTITADIVAPALGDYTNVFGGPGVTVTNDAGNSVLVQQSEAVLSVIDNGGISINKFANVQGNRYSASNREPALTIMTGNDWVYEIVFGNGTASDVSNVNLTDDIGALLPSFMQLYSADSSFTGSPGCTGTLVADEATDVVSLTNATIPAGGTCTLLFKVLHGLEGNGLSTRVDNTIPKEDITINGTEYPIDVVGPLFRNAAPFDPRPSFSPATVGPGGISRLNFQVVMFNNASPFNADSFGWSETLPADVIVADDPNISVTCGVVSDVTAVPGSSSIAVNVENFDAHPHNCRFGIDVKVDVPANAPPDSGQVFIGSPSGGSTDAFITRSNVPTASGISTGGTRTVRNARLSWTGIDVSVAKSFSPTSLSAGEVTRLTLEIINTDALSNTLTNTGITDVYPAGMVNAPNPNPTFTSAGGTCNNATITAVPGADSITLSGASVGRNARCRLSVDVVPNISGTVVNTIPAGSLTNDLGATNTTTSSGSVNVAPSIRVEKGFTPNRIGAGTISTADISIRNITNADLDLNSPGLTDALPAGLIVAPTPNITTQCGIAITAAAGDTSIVLSGGSVPANDICTITVDVTSASGGTYVNEIPAGAISSVSGITNFAGTSSTIEIIEVDALPETFAPVSGINGGASTSVLGSDTYIDESGTAVPATSSNVTITAPVPGDYTDAGGSPVTGLTLDPATGLITVAPGTPAGTYSISYEICAIGEATCDTQVETIVVNDPPVAVDDEDLNNATGSAVTLDITGNDTDDVGVDPMSVNLVTPTGATNVVTDADGDVIGFVVPGEGTWSVNETTGQTTFTPLPSYAGDPTPVDYTVRDDNGAVSNVATITIDYDQVPSLSVVKSVASIADTNGNGLVGDFGDVVTYDFTVTNTGDTSLGGVSITDAKLGLTDEPVTPADLGPGQSGVLTGQTYSLTMTDVDNLQVENTASASGAPVETLPNGDADPATPLLDNTGTPLANVTDTSDTGTEPDLDASDNPVSVTNPETTDTNGTSGDDDAEPTIVNLSRFPVPVSPSAPAELGHCVSGGNWGEMVFASGGSGTTGTADVTTTGFSGVTFPASAASTTYTGPQFSTKTSIENMAYFFIRINPLDSGPTTPVGHTPFSTTFTQSFSGEDLVYEVRQHWWSLDQLGWSFDPALNPGVGWEYLSGSDDTGNAGTSTNPNLVDAIDRDQDGQGANSVQNTDSRKSADFSIRLYSTNGQPLSQIVWSFEEDRSSSSAPDGFGFSMEVCSTPPSVDLVKSVSGYADTNGNGVMDAGDTVNYSFSVENTSVIELQNLTISDPLPGVVITGNSITSLAPGGIDTTSITASYELQPADITAGGVENTAQVGATVLDSAGNPIENPDDPLVPFSVVSSSDAGTDPDGNPLANPEVIETADLDEMTDSDPTNDPTVFQITPTPSVEIVKFLGAVRDVNGNSVLDAGDEVDYTFSVTNTGNTDLSGVTVTDPKVTVSGAPIDLAIGASDSATFTAIYAITATDVAAGGVENTAQVSGTAVDSNGDPIIDPVSGQPRTAEDDSDTGSETLLDSSGDPIDATNSDTTDTPGLTSAPDGDPTNDPTVLIIPNPAMTVVKSVATVLDDNIPGGDGLFGGDGDTINYSFTVTNTGNVDLVGITLTDPKATVSGGPLDLAIGAGESLTFTATYTVLPADTALGYIENTATAAGNAVDSTGNPLYGPDGTPVTVDAVSDAGTDPDANPVTDPLATETPDGTGTTDTDPTNDPTVTSVPSNPAPRLSVIKSVASVADTSADGLIGEGDTVTYSFAVTNTGNVDLADVALTDANATVAGGPITLAIGATDTATFTATHVITAAEAAAGAVENSAQATGNAVNSAGDPLIDPATGLQRTAEDVSDAGTDPDIDASGTPTAYTDPLGNETPDATGGTDTDPTNDPTVLFLPMPQMQVVKSVASVDDTNGNGFTDAGDTVSYAFAVTNTGNTDLIDIVVSDALAGVVLSGNPIGSLLQGSTDTTVTATYVLTTADVDAGSVENTAEATGTAVNDMGTPLGDPTSPGDPLTVSDTSDAGTDPNGDPVTDPEGTETPSSVTPPNGIPGDDPTTFLVEPAPALELTKSVGSINDVDGDGLPGEGDIITYTFSVTNTGNVDLSDVAINDPLGVVSGGPIDLAIGDTDTSTFSLDYTLTAADVAAGVKENSATASGTAVDSTGAVINDPITGNPLTALDTSDAGTEPELGTGGTPDPVVDPETTETPDGTGSTDGDPANDPTVLALPNPQLTLVKSVAQVLDDNVAGGDGLFGGEGDTVNYQFTVTNTGNVDLVGVTLTDALAPVTGGPIDLAVGAGDSLTFTSTYTVTAADVARGFLENTATATGSAVNSGGDPLLDLNGNPITTTDTSDTGTDPDGDDVSDPELTETPDGTGTTDGDPTNDPTVTTVPANPRPEISVIKSVSSIADEGDGMLGAGDTVTFSFEVTNTGNVDLGDVVITDALANVSGGPITLPVGATDATTFTATHVITAAEATAGFVENTAEATGGAVNSAGDPITDPTTGAQLTTSDTSDAGTEPEIGATGQPDDVVDPEGNETTDSTGTVDGDPTNDPTVLFIPNPSLSVVKSIASVPDTNNDGLFGGPGDVITYAFTVTNTGNVTLDNVVVTDAKAVVSGGPVTLTAGQADSSTITATYTVTAADIATGYVENTATGSGDAIGTDGNPLGNPVDPGTPITVTDTSDSGTNPNGTSVTDPEGTETPDGTGTTDGDPANDPTVTNVPANPEPEISIIKSVAAVFDTDQDAVLGGEDDEVTYQFAVTNTGNVDLANVIVNDPMLGGVIGTIPLIPVGATETFTTSYIITEADQAAGQVENTATATGTGVNGSGTPLIDPSTGSPYEATDVSDAGTDSSVGPVVDPEGTETPSIGSPDGDPTNDPTLITVPLAVPDTAVSGTVFFDANQDGSLNTGDSGLQSYIVQLVDQNGDVVATTTSGPDGTYSMAGFAIGTLSLQFIDPSSNEVVGTIGNLVFGRNTVLMNQNQPIPPAMADTALVATKSTNVRNVFLGGVVPYTITIENTQAVPIDFNLVDQLPTGLVYLPDSGLVDGVAVEPVVEGSTLTWPSLNVATGQTVVFELVARVGPNAPVGELVNTATAVDGTTGNPLSNAATAIVRRNVEAVFDCSHVIGKVFDDRNMDGYQNALPNTRSQISDQSSFGKGQRPVSSDPHGEPGLPNVRLVTATGTIITTDEYGRYSVPCAELPRSMGSNFTLKLDTRSLPTGYRVTTENPRVMRLTAGIMAEMNFGAAIGRVIDIDLTAKAFTSGNTPVDALTVGVEQILQKIAKTPAVLRISYFEAGEDQSVIDDRLDHLEDHIQERWRKIGDYRLIVERTIKLLQ